MTWNFSADADFFYALSGFREVKSSQRSFFFSKSAEESWKFWFIIMI
jgi:hypothetical protein